VSVQACIANPFQCLTELVGIGCLRSGYICEGYPTTARYQENASKRAKESPRPPSPRGQASPTAQHDAVARTNSPQTPGPDGVDHFLDWFFLDETIDSFAAGFRDSPPVPCGPLSSTNVASHLPTTEPGPLQRTTGHPPREIPRSLPFLINGVNSLTEQKFFAHFTNVTSRVLTISSDSNNPLLAIVLPRSLQDPMIQKAVSCLGGSHLVNLQPDAESHLLTEKRRLLKDAETQQAARISALSVLDRRQRAVEFETVLTSTLLLCLYEISEGRGDLSWRVRLNTARSLIQDAVQTSSSIALATSGTSEDSTTLEVDQFLLDFFLYHDILAGVTDRTTQPILQPAARTVARSNSDDVYMMGIDNGLFDLIAKIAALRTKAMAKGNLDASVVCEALMLWEELDAWHPGTNDNDQRLAFSAYTSALFVWLYVIIYPNNIADAKVQTAVQCGLSEMKQIQASGVMAFLLFPAFVIGFASVATNEREQASAQFERLSRFSGLGNIRLAHDVVKRSWADYDNGMRSSWDWTRQMEMHGISLPVT